MTDEKLIRQYVSEASEDAFGQIVERYLKMVYAVCLREVRNPEMAQDAAQVVFVLLAQKARGLRSGTVLSSWLFTTARFASKAALRQEYRRRKYETQAVDQMRQNEERREHSTAGDGIEPWLNEALAGLKPKDREALLLRFAEERSLREIGERCGISEVGAHLRVTRALEKLRNGLRKRGVDAPETSVLTNTLPLLLTGSILILPGSVSAAAVAQAVPGILAGTAGATIAGARLIQLSQGVNLAMRIQQIKIAAIVLTGCVAAGAGTAKLVYSGSLTRTTAGISRGTSAVPPVVNNVQYTVTDLGTLPECDTSHASSINNKGEIVGSAGNEKIKHDYARMFYYYNGSMRDVALPAGYTAPWRPIINDRGTIIANGEKDNAPDQHYGFMGTKDKLALYTPSANTHNVWCTGINNKGMITGAYSAELGPGEKGFGPGSGFLIGNGTFQAFDHPALNCTGINDNGQVVGTTMPGRKGFVYSNGTVTLLPDTPECLRVANAINAHGDVVGYTHNKRTFGDTAFLYHNGSMIDLGTAAGFSTSNAWAINTTGTVVGEISKEDVDGPRVTHAAIFVNGQAADLNTLIDPALGWELTEARGINDNGQIVGSGVHNGKQHAFLLAPKS